MIPLIQNCGSVAIKFCQWALPKLELLLMSETDIYNRNVPVWIRKLEMFFENCPIFQLNTRNNYTNLNMEKSLTKLIQ